MRRFNENNSSNIIIAFCRMNPFTKGHEKLIEKVTHLAELLNAPHEIILTHSYDSTYNPLTLEEKLYFARKIFPGVNFTSSNKEAPTIMFQLDRLREEGYQHITLVAGSDRVGGFRHLVDEYEMDDVSVLSAGQRTTDEITATKIREAAMFNDWKTFRKGVPSHLTDEDTHELFHAVRKGMKLINT